VKIVDRQIAYQTDDDDDDEKERGVKMREGREKRGPDRRVRKKGNGCGRGAYFHFIPGQITFAYTVPPTGLLTNGENMTHHHNCN